MGMYENFNVILWIKLDPKPWVLEEEEEGEEEILEGPEYLVEMTIIVQAVTRVVSVEKIQYCTDGGKQLNSYSMSVHLKSIILLQRLRSAVDGVLLHVFRHVSILNNSLSVGHCFGGFSSKFINTSLLY